jgi:hypothetical protein
MQRSTISVLAVLAGMVVVGLLASGAGAARIVQQFHGTFSDVNPVDNQCGIAGSSYDSGMDNIQVFADGTFKDQFTLKYVFTSDATGKSFEIHVAQQQTSTLETVNPDGSMTFVDTFIGLPEQIKIPHGPVLSRDAGNVTFLDTFDADGNFLSRTVVDEKGPHPDLDSDFTLFCDVIVPAIS